MQPSTSGNNQFEERKTSEARKSSEEQREFEARTKSEAGHNPPPSRGPPLDPKQRTRVNVRQLVARLAVSSQTVWRWYSKGDFPKPHYLCQNRVWWLDEVIDWEEKQMATRSAPPAVRDRKSA